MGCCDSPDDALTRYGVSREVREQIDLAISEGNKIAAIKTLRDATGLDLSTSRTVIESYM